MLTRMEEAMMPKNRSRETGAAVKPEASIVGIGGWLAVRVWEMQDADGIGHHDMLELRLMET